jgi:hypothetical protein
VRDGRLGGPQLGMLQGNFAVIRLRWRWMPKLEARIQSQNAESLKVQLVRVLSGIRGE